MSNFAYIAFYPGKWLGRTAKLSAVERGVFITLICEMYENMEPLKYDEKRLARLCGTTPATFRKVCDILLEDGNLLVRNGGGIWNLRVEKEIKHAKNKSKTQSEISRSGWKKRKENKATAKPRQSYPEPYSNCTTLTSSTVTDKKTEANASTKKSSKGFRLPDDWQVTPDLISFAIAEGLNFHLAHREADKFRDYWHSATGANATKKRWDLAFRNWVRIAADRLPSGQGKISNTEKNLDMILEVANELSDH